MNTQDQELLELAALAVGNNSELSDDLQAMHWHELQSMGAWNPLEDDGDAFRLMVSLGIEVNRVNCMKKTICFYSRHGAIIQFDEQSNCDPCASTRRAIVLAAAAIGERL